MTGLLVTFTSVKINKIRRYLKHAQKCFIIFNMRARGASYLYLMCGVSGGEFGSHVTNMLRQLHLLGKAGVHTFPFPTKPGLQTHLPRKQWANFELQSLQSSMKTRKKKRNIAQIQNFRWYRNRTGQYRWLLPQENRVLIHPACSHLNIISSHCRVSVDLIFLTSQI